MASLPKEFSRERRNKERLAFADEADASTVGESTRERKRSRATDGEKHPSTHSHTRLPLDDEPENYFERPIRGPDDTFETPEWFLIALKNIAGTDPEVPGKAPIVFENTEEAAAANATLLKTVDFDIERLIRENATTTLGYGSEFRTVDQLRPLIGRHPHFSDLSKVLISGMPYVFERELDQVTKLRELRALLLRGNHKSAKESPDRVSALLTKDVTHGFVIPLPTSIVEHIPHAAIQPLGLARQWSLDEEGTRVVKYRMTQDLSFTSERHGPSRSINSRINMAAYAEMIYGWCLPRILHYIVATRLVSPTVIIFICKYDYSDAYRRIAHSASAAAQTIATHMGLAYLSLRLTYGGCPNPPTWTMFSEIVTDLANEISQCRAWDPKLTRSPAQPVAPPPQRLESSIPVQTGRPMAVDIPITTPDSGRVDGFIDDLINVFTDTPNNCSRQPHVVPLAMHVTSRPHAGDALEPTPRRTLLSIPKLLAEGSPAEIQIVLGWRLDTRRLLIALPDDKFGAWSEDLSRIISQPRCRFEDIDQMVGRLNHSSFVLPFSRHFMGRLRELLKPRRHKDCLVPIGREAKADFTLWQHILSRANKGVSMNLIVTRRPSRICWSDACPFGMGGYSLSGRAWRLRVPVGNPLRGHPGVNNLLEFTAMVVNIWLECLDATTGDFPCILAVGDSTSAIGWLFKTAGLDLTGTLHKSHLMVARHLATLLIDHDCCLASQHLRGSLNVVADLLSFSGESERGKPHPIAHDDPPDDILTDRFLSVLTEQVPANFAISPLPKEVLSWVTRVLRTAALSLTVVKNPGTKTPTASGAAGRASDGAPGSQMTPSSLCYLTTNRNFMSKHSYKVTDTQLGPPPGTLQATVSNLWSQALSAKPQATWLRRFGAISGTAPCTCRAVPTSAPSSDHC